MENQEQKELNGYKLQTNSGKISQSTELFSGYYMTTPSEKYYLVMQNDGNLVIYADPKFEVVVWDAESYSTNPAEKYALQINGDSQLQIYEASTPSKNVIWDSNNKRHAGMKNGVLVLNDNGQLILSDLDKDQVLWKSNDQNKPRELSNTIDTDKPRYTIYDEQYLKHDNFLLKMQKDGNLVLYRGNFQSENAKWSSGTFGKGEGPYRAVIQKDGNFVIYDKNNSSTWASQTPNQGNGHYNVDLQGDGNLVLYDSDRKVIWKTDTAI